MPRNETLGYNACYEIISKISNRNICLFADGWSRFPEGKNLNTLLDELQKDVEFWQNQENEKAIKYTDDLQNVIFTLEVLK